MVGNDVVDIGDTRRRARHVRFDARVFSDGERRAIANDDDCEARRWAHWAAKESAYKVAKRCDSDTIFSPVKFTAEFDGGFAAARSRSAESMLASLGQARSGSAGSLDDELHGSVRHGSVDYPVRVRRRGDCIHAVAVAPGHRIDAMLAGVGPYPDTADADSPSRAVRRLAIRDLSPQFEPAKGGLVVRSKERIPELQHLDGHAVAMLSLSHHGRFVAYACALAVSTAERGPALRDLCSLHSAAR
jgi:phosphopantetheinyl transferase (holo-ACP synthase)